MNWLLDTNVIMRLADAKSSESAVAEAAIEHLIAHDEPVYIASRWRVAAQRLVSASVRPHHEDTAGKAHSVRSASENHGFATALYFVSFCFVVDCQSSMSGAPALWKKSCKSWRRPCNCWA